MWGGAPWGAVPWAGLALTPLDFPTGPSSPSGHGRSYAGRYAVQAYLAQQAKQMEISILQENIFRETTRQVGLRLFLEMQQKIQQRDEDDIFLILSV